MRRLFPVHSHAASTGIAWWEWTLATVIGWMVALGLAGFVSSWGSIPYRYPLYLGPLFMVHGYWIAVVFAGIGLVSSLPQAWLMRNWSKYAYTWVTGTSLGAGIGGIFVARLFSVANFAGGYSWAFYPVFTAFPNTLIQAVVLYILSRQPRAWAWLPGKILFLVAFCIIPGAIIGIAAYHLPGNVFMSAFLYSVGIGFPMGSLSSLLLKKIIKKPVPY